MAEEKKNKSGGAIIIGTIFVAIIILLLVFSLQGKTTTTGDYPENVSDKSLVCTGNDIEYPIFTYDKSNKKELEISLLFTRDKIRSIALRYSLYYNDTIDITGSEAHNHAAMNISFGKDGMGADALNATYARLDNRMQMNLYATNDQIDSTALKYFLINSDGDYIPNTIDNFKAIYENKGLACETKE